jgi:hypothetical protein
MSIYEQGYISIANGSIQAEGFGTRWLNYVKPGDTITINGNTFTVSSVDDNHLLKINEAYSGATQDRAKYYITKAAYAESLAEAIVRVHGEIDRVSGITRLRFITVSAGQEVTYIAKLEDAKAYIAAGYPTNSAPYVWVHNEAIATGATPTQVADLIVYTAGLWSAVGSQVEGARQAAKMAVSAAGSVQDMEDILGDFKVAMAGL